jgi:phosphoglycerate dehydrogenase-like enzyme
MSTLAVTFGARQADRAVIAEAIGEAAKVVYLADLDDGRRISALRGATAILARNTDTDLRPGEALHIQSARLIQFLTAGIDFVKLSALPAGVPVASNGGAYAEPMAEHGLAILGFGGIGVASARLMRAMGMRIHAINRSGRSEEPTDWIGPISVLETLLAAADVLIICTPLTPATNDLIGARELGLMKPDAILVNLARGEIIQEAALFAHLQTHPDFYACIDAWWVEPVRHGSFRTNHPFLALPNVIGSPHNSASIPGITDVGLRRAIANVRRALAGEAPHYVVGPADRMG